MTTQPKEIGEKAGSASPVLSWDNLNYDVKTKGHGVRRILHDLSGSIYPGELVAIMGSSGAGKTTLLNTLSGRLQGGRLYGDIKFNGAKRVPHDFKRMLAYVEQDDLLHGALTVEETLMASARLRLPNSKYTDADKRERVETVMRQLRLSHIADTPIGGQGIRGVSGGERKRVSIGMELVTDPSILVLDEPSSGLDSSSAEMVVALTKEMAHARNLCTLMTIHQPSAEMVAQFDKLILLAQGKMVYMGPADQALRYFEQLGYPSTNSNPANFFIDLMTIDFSESEARVQHLVGAFAEFRQGGVIEALPSNSFASAATTTGGNVEYSGNNSTNLSIKTGSEKTGASGSNSYSDHSNVLKDITHEAVALATYEVPPLNSWFSEVLVLLKRDWDLCIRNRPLVYGFLGQCLVMLLFQGFVFFQLKTNQASVQNRIGALFSLVVQCTFPVAIPTMTVIMSGRGVLLRERSSGTYRMSSYFVARALSFFPIVYSLYYVMYTGMYFIAHLQYDAGKYFIGLAIVSVVVFASLGYAFAMAMIVSRMEVAHIITPVSLATFMLFAGNMSNASAITPVLRWIKYVCIFYYAYSGFVQNEFGGLEFTCSPSDVSCYDTGKSVIEAYGLNSVPIWLTIILNLVLGIGFYAIAYGAVRWIAKPRYLWL
ncbi:P-loop containing nucleoside triphosphate hydrolase protein [Coemansia spiralis]|nr:P-loop containing nucleoside triphosphate hydrolase protein [Coemansia spiralis]